MLDLNEVLELVVAKQKQCDELEATLKEAKRQRDHIESMAAEALAASGLEKVTCHGKTWRVETSVHVNVLKENRDAVLEAAKAEGIADEVTTVGTSTLKSWLIEKCKERGAPLDSESIASGTAFDGLISAYSEPRLRSRAV